MTQNIITCSNHDNVSWTQIFNQRLTSTQDLTSKIQQSEYLTQRLDRQCQPNEKWSKSDRKPPQRLVPWLFCITFLTTLGNQVHILDVPKMQDIIYNNNKCIFPVVKLAMSIILIIICGFCCQDQQCKELSQRHVSRRAKKLKVKVCIQMEDFTM